MKTATSTPVITDFYTDEMTDDEAASAVLAAVKSRALPLVALHPMVAHYIASVRRRGVRDAEREVRSIAPRPLVQIRPAARRTFAGATELQKQVAAERSSHDWKLLLNRSFTITRGGKVVTWGEATIAEHLERAEALERQGESIAHTASMHREAVRDCRAAGVDALRFLPDVAA